MLLRRGGGGASAERLRRVPGAGVQHDGDERYRADDRAADAGGGRGAQGAAGDAAVRNEQPRDQQQQQPEPRAARDSDGSCGSAVPHAVALEQRAIGPVPQHHFAPRDQGGSDHRGAVHSALRELRKHRSGRQHERYRADAGD